MRVSVRARSVVVVACLLGLAGCRRSESISASDHEGGVPSAGPDAAPSATSTGPAGDAAADGALLGRTDASTSPTATGTVRLVVQHVEATCMVAPGEPPRSFKVGVDLLVEMALGEDGGAGTREHVFCPKALADGGKAKPRLDMWENCRRDAACVITRDGGVDANGTGPIAVTCGKDAVELVVEDGKTLLRGSFGERVVAPHPMRLLPVVKVRREAYVDC